MTISEFMPRLENFIREEFEVYQAGFLEKDNSIYQTRYDAFFKEYAIYGIRNYRFAREKRIDDRYIEETGKVRMEHAIARILFQVKRYEGSPWGTLFRCYTNDTMSSRIKICGYRECLFFAEYEGSYRIISIYTTRYPGVKSYDSQLRGFEYSQGKEITDLGALREVMKLFPPDEPVSLKDYLRKESVSPE